MQLDSIISNLSKIADMPRHLISDGYDAALKIIEDTAVASGLNFKVHTYPTGYDCGTWIVPEKWSLRKAQLQDGNGNVLLDAEREPLACVSYSQPFKGKVSREELLPHLHSGSHCPEAVPFIFKYYKRDWGLCCNQGLKDSLQDDEYYVTIDAEFTAGELKVGEIVVEGQVEECFMVASHLCHPHQVNDGPIGIFPTIEILHDLQQQHPHYTFRQLIVPETIGSAAWLSGNQELIPLLKGGLFVEMIGTDLPLRLHRSFKGNTLVDAFFTDVVRENSNDSIIDEFYYGNDERQFNGPGVEIPMLALSRSDMSREQIVAFPYYHTSFDTMKNVNVQNLAESITLLYSMLKGFDRYLLRPIPHFIGEPFLTRYGLHIDSFKGIDQMRQSNLMMDILFMCDKDTTIYEIGKRLQVTPETVRKVLDRFVEKDLVSYSPL